MTESQAPAEREEPPRWQIGQLAALAATTARAIRLYEAAGLLPEPARSGVGADQALPYGHCPRRRQPGAGRGPGAPAGGPEWGRQDHAAARAGRPGAANRGLGAHPRPAVLLSAAPGAGRRGVPRPDPAALAPLGPAAPGLPHHRRSPAPSAR